MPSGLLRGLLRGPPSGLPNGMCVQDGSFVDPERIFNYDDNYSYL